MENFWKNEWKKEASLRTKDLYLIGWLVGHLKAMGMSDEKVKDEINKAKNDANMIYGED
jgi:hypothetical protein